MSIDVIAATVRAASFVVTLQSVGSVLFLLLFERHLTESAGSIRTLARRSALLAMGLVGAHYALEAGRMGGELASVTDPQLQGMALRSPLALAAAMRLGGLMLIAWSTWRTSVRRAAAVGALATIAAFAFVGHTTMHPAGTWLRPALVIHVGFAAFWFGSLLPLLIALKREALPSASAVIDRFSAWAVWLVPALFLAGVVLLAALTRFDPQVFRSAYGRILAFKIFAFGVLLGLAALNRNRLAPRLKLGRGSAVHSFVTSVSVEILLLGFVIAATAFLTALYSPD